MIGIVGCHRVGKTTLARKFAEQYGFTFVETNVSGVFAEMGLDPKLTYDFTTRLSVQKRILKHLNTVYAQYQREHDTDIITDRTPLDLLIYTYAEVAGNNLTDAETEELIAYTEDCLETINRRFSFILALQPGLPVIETAGKGAVNPAYLEHLNTLTIGLVGDERVKVKTAYIPRHITDLDRRLNALWMSYRSHFDRQANISAESFLH